MTLPERFSWLTKSQFVAQFVIDSEFITAGLLQTTLGFHFPLFHGHHDSAAIRLAVSKKNR